MYPTPGTFILFYAELLYHLYSILSYISITMFMLLDLNILESFMHLHNWYIVHY